MLVAKFRQRLMEAARAGRLSQAEQEVLNRFDAALVRFDNVDIEALIEMFQLFKLKSDTPAKVRAVVEHPVADELKSVMADDQRFDSALDRVASNKKLTKPILTGVYKALFGSLEGVPSKATRNDLIDLIRRERIIVVRNRKTGRLQGRGA